MIKVKKLDAGRVRLIFSLPSTEHPGPVSVVGPFNGWDPHRHPLVKRSNGTRSATVDLEPPEDGRVCFRYLDTHGQWFGDATADDVAPNDHGGTNDVVDLRTRLAR